MSRTLEDLRSTLQAYGAEQPPSSARTLGVHKRIRRLRRQRFVAAAAAIALVAGVGTIGLRAARTTERAASTSHVPAYAWGGKLAATIALDSRVSGSSSTTISVPTTSIIIGADAGEACLKVGLDQLAVTILVNGRESGAVTCGGTVTTPVTAGARVTIELRLSRGIAKTEHFLTKAELAALPRVHTYNGVYLPVPRSAYHFPPAPKTLPALDQLAPPTDALFDSMGNARKTIQVNVSDGLRLAVVTVAPGVITATLDGKPLEPVETWTYGLTSDDLSKTAAELTAMGITGSTASLVVTATDFSPRQGQTLWRVYRQY